MLLRITLLLSIVCCTVSVVHADDATKSAKVHELFAVMKMDQLTTQVMKLALNQVNSGMMQQMLGVKLPPEQDQAVSEFSAKVDKIVSDALSWDNLEPEYAKLYAAAYTEQQIDDILVFYKSPTGQAVIEKGPVLMKQSNAIARQRLMTQMPQIQELMKDFIAHEAAKSQQAKPKP